MGHQSLLEDSPVALLVRRRSRELGLSMQALADATGIARSHLYKLMDGSTQDPAISTVYNLSAALKISPIVLLRHFAGLCRLGRQECPTTVVKGLKNEQDLVAFSADVTVPDHSMMLPGEAFTKEWSIQNVGHEPWIGRRMVRSDDEYVIARREGNRLVPVLDSHLFSAVNVVDVPDTMPGMPCNISVNFVAPKENCSVASLWRMQDSKGAFCYPPAFFLQAIVTVVGT